MELIRGVYNLKPHHRGCVATIGNFDGVHLGHQALINALKEQAEKLHVPSVVIIFEPQPQEYFAATQAWPRLTRLREKLVALQQCDIDRVLCLRFDRDLAKLTAEQFVQKILIDGLAVRGMTLGDDFHFGYQRAGDIELLRQFGAQQHFEVVQMATLKINGQRVSSRRVREVLSSGELVMAKQLLGRSYTMFGRVTHGDQRGRILGFPTANIYLRRQASPILGVYAVTVTGIKDESVQGVANIGNRPTVDGSKTLLEVHLFDFNENIYGRHVQVTFLHKLRDEQRFENFELLKAQIFRDAEAARTYFF